MSGFKDVMKLKELAEEDIYFARIDRELVEKLHREAAAARGQQAAEQAGAPPEEAGPDGPQDAQPPTD